MTLSPAWLGWPETKTLLTIFAAANAPIRFVGGAVRDALLRIDVQDIDAATPLPPKAAMALLQKAGVQVIPTGIKHGTITALIGKKHFEITTLREDISTDGRHAKVKFTDDWQKDASRRDFTMNALYLSANGELSDYFGGREDAKAGRVIFIGDPAQRIEEDYLRVLRFFRFHAHYGSGAPDEKALAACAAAAKKLAGLSGERIRHELLKLLAAPRPSETLEIMRQKKLIAPLLGYDVRNVEILERFERIEDALRITVDPVVKLTVFLLGIGAELSQDEALAKLTKRLRLSNDMLRELRLLVTHQKELTAHMNEAEQKHFIRKLGPDNFIWSLVVNWAQSREPISAKHPYVEMVALARDWHPPEFPVTGNDLIALGIKPGKKMGELLEKLEAQWEKSNFTLTRDQLLRMK